jgi:signal transduction histidine kinase
MDPIVAQSILQDRKMTYAITDRKLNVMEVRGSGDILSSSTKTSLGHSLLELVPELVGSEEVLADILAGELPRFELVWVNRETVGGETIYLTMVALPYRDQTGQILGLIHLVEDVTEMGTLQQRLVQHRNELRLLRDQLAERTAELETFSYSVSHDLRAPLRVIQGLSQALLEDYAERLDSVGQDYAGNIVAAAQHMDILIRDLLAYSHLSRAEIELKPVSLKQVVEEVLSQLEAEIRESGAQLIVEQPLPTVMGHYATLLQVVANLLTNAVKFVAPGVQPRVRMWSEERENKVCLWAGDNGIGIAPKDQQRIFRVFERLHGRETYPGTGIGLAIVHKGVRRMGGQVGVESEIGQGSRFWVELRKVEERTSVLVDSQRQPTRR